MMKVSGGMKTSGLATVALALVLTVTTPAMAAGSQAVAGHGAGQSSSSLKDFFISAIDVINYAARTTSDTVHHNIGNVMGTAAKARGFVRDTVSGVLGNARKVTGMVGDVMPFTEHNHYEGGAKPKKAAE